MIKLEIFHIFQLFTNQLFRYKLEFLSTTSEPRTTSESSSSSLDITDGLQGMLTDLFDDNKTVEDIHKFIEVK